MKRKYGALPESMSKMEMYGFHWMEFVTQIPSPLYIITSYKSNGLTNACCSLGLHLQVVKAVFMQLYQR